MAGIHIFLNEYYHYLGKRAEFFIPTDVEERLQKGNRMLYEKQHRYWSMSISDPRLHPLAELIHHHKRGYEQEGYIK